MLPAAQPIARYGINADAYLARAKSRLEENTAEALFYAAFELRCFVEARQDDYLDAQKEYARSIPKAYKIGAQGKALERIFDSKQIQFFAFAVDGGEIYKSYHVPVSRKLRNETEWLGNLLHAQMKWRALDDPWWQTTRERVLAIYRLAWKCSQGNLPSPLFLVNGNTVGNIRYYGEDDELKWLMTILKPGTKGLMHVDYLKTPPEAWRCDL
jgi:hypothetical protein